MVEPATFWERAAHSVCHMFPLYFDSDIVILVISHFGFESETLVLIASVPGIAYLLASCRRFFM